MTEQVWLLVMVPTDR